jgi:uncharacterized protein YndB with AHSA1/START domain
MSDWSIRTERSLAAPAEVVWRCVGTPELISRWWCPPPTVRIDLDPVTRVFRERYDDGELRYAVVGSVVVYEPPSRLTVRRETPASAAPADRIAITLIPTVEGTQVLLEHSFEELPVDRRDEMVDFYADGWQQALSGLASIAAAEHAAS